MLNKTKLIISIMSVVGFAGSAIGLQWLVIYFALTTGIALICLCGTYMVFKPMWDTIAENREGINKLVPNLSYYFKNIDNKEYIVKIMFFIVVVSLSSIIIRMLFIALYELI